MNDSERAVIKTTHGMIRGIPIDGNAENIIEFRSVPYAKPPVGNLRWAPPVEMEPWQGVLDCTGYAPIAPQQIVAGNNVYADDFRFLGTPSMSEDCLYMNITVKADGGKNKPVFIWFHGGALDAGWSYEPQFSGVELALRGAVVISVASRLGIFGYLSLPQLSECQGGSSGNYGLMDGLKAFEWIRENAENFGGDPENITVGGESGGTIKATALVFSPSTKGKVKNCILQSGLKWDLAYNTQEQNDENSIEFLQECGIAADATVEELRAVPTEVLLRAKLVGKKRMSLGNICDGRLVPHLSCAEAMKTYGEGINVICGTNLGESSIDVAKANPRSMTSDEFYSFYKKLVGEELYRKYDFERIIKVTDENAARTARYLSSYGLCESSYFNYSRNLMHCRLFGKLMSKRFPGTGYYAYLFSHVLPSKPEDTGTYRDPDNLLCYHGSELFFTFASLLHIEYPSRSWLAADYVLAKRVSSLWFNFMSTGNPNGPTEEWPKGNAGAYYCIGETPELLRDCAAQIDELIEEYICKTVAGFAE